jgi:hypothetical protein
VAARAVIAGMLVSVVAVIVRGAGVHRAMHGRVRRVELAQRNEPRQRSGLQRQPRQERESDDASQAAHDDGKYKRGAGQHATLLCY